MSELHSITHQPDQADDVLHEGWGLARLAVLHDEAAQTTRLANLLGRTPWLAAVLGMATFVAFAWFGGPDVEPASLIWIGFALAGAITLFALYRRALRAPFDLASLHSFHADLKAALLYAGFAWGAGTFFLGPQHNLLVVIAFSAGMGALVELALRSPHTALWFVVPATLMPAAAIGLGPLGLPSAGMVLVGGLSVFAAGEAIARLSAPRAPVLLTVS